MVSCAPAGRHTPEACFSGSHSHEYLPLFFLSRGNLPGTLGFADRPRGGDRAAAPGTRAHPDLACMGLTCARRTTAKAPAGPIRSAIPRPTGSKTHPNPELPAEVFANRGRAERMRLS